MKGVKDTTTISVETHAITLPPQQPITPTVITLNQTRRGDID